MILLRGLYACNRNYYIPYFFTPISVKRKAGVLLSA
jgi:hypothetical protein